MSVPTDRWCMAAILVLALALRLAWLDTIPPPLHQDEASRGYDAWCIAHTGADRWGARRPFFLRGYGPGDYTGAISTYLMVPFVAALGPTVTAIRLSNALCGVLTVLAAWLLARRLFDARTAVLAALLLAVCPWHVFMTRTGHESALVPFFLTLGLLGMACSGLPPFDDPPRPPRRRWAFFAGVMFALDAWVYPAPRMFVPLFILGCFLFFPRRWWRQLADRSTRRGVIAFVVGLAAASAPLWITLWQHPEQLAARAKATSLWYAPLSGSQRALRVIENYFAELSPATLCFQTNDIAMKGSRLESTEYGRLLHVELPLALIGFLELIGVTALRRNVRSRRFHGGLLLWFALAPLPAAVCGDWNPNYQRAFVGLPLWSFLSAVGGVALFDAARRHAPAAARALLVAGAAVILVNAAWFPYIFVTRQPARIADFNQENLRRAIEYATQREAKYDFIWVTRYSNQPYIYCLLAGPMPPRDFQQSNPLLVPGPSQFDQLLRIGKWLFAPNDQPRNDLGRAAVAAFRRELLTFPPEARGLIIDAPHNGPPGKVIETIRRRDGSVDWEIREARMFDVPLPHAR